MASKEPDSLKPELPDDREWLAITAVRDAFSISRHEPTTYREAVGYAIQIAPDLIGPASLFAGGLVPTLSDFYRAKAATLSHVAERVSPLTLARVDLEEVMVLLKTATPDATSALNGRRRELLRAVADLDEDTWTENQALVHDYGVPPNTDVGPLPISGRGKGYTEYRGGQGRVLRTRMLHPDPAEWKLGLDLIYETYRFDDFLPEPYVRISALQYKTWNGKALYLDSRAEEQMRKAHRAFCASGFCECSDDASPRPYRFPHCCIFLRPTNRVQTRTGWQATRGWHVPMCGASAAIQKTGRGGKVIRADAVKGSSLNQAQFSALFGQEMIGSDWFPASGLEEVYDKAGAMTVERPVLHVQDYPSPQPTDETEVWM
jgi:hypothetical protein